MSPYLLAGLVVTSHGYSVGQSVTIRGATEPEYNGTFAITSVTTHTFDFTVTGTPSSDSTSGMKVTTSNVFNKDLLTAVRYPDKSTGSASAGEQETFSYTAVGQKKTYRDRNGSAHRYDYDVLGRMTADAVTTLGSGVDGSVRRLEYSFDTAGLPYQFTGYDAASSGSVVNQVRRIYNGIGQTTKEYQEHDGSVNTSTSAKVQYAYSEMGSSANHSRLTSMTYPDGRVLHYVYASGIDSNISRLTSLVDNDNSTHLEDLKYLGLNSIVERNHPENGVKLSYINQFTALNTPESGQDTVGGDQYTGLDLFGRVVDQNWLTVDGSGYVATTTDRFQYSYDRDSNVLYKNNVQHPTSSGGTDSRTFSELYSGTDDVDANSMYDSLNRLTGFQRGSLSAAGSNNGSLLDTVSSASHTLVWSLDAVGNWSSLNTDGGGAVSRTHDKQNELTAINGSSLDFDANGNTTDDLVNTYTYDAWNHIAGTTIVTEGDEATFLYEYDALDRRIIEGAYRAGSGFQPGDTNLYYADNQQVIEERTDDFSGSIPEVGDGYVHTKTQTVWSPVYIDALVLRDVAIDDQSGEPEESRGPSDTDIARPHGPAGRLYVQQDANWNTTAVTNTSGTVQQRFIYDPYGEATYLNASWSGDMDNFAFAYLHQGGRRDSVTGLVAHRARDENVKTGRWMQQDPAGYVDGANLYEFVGDSPVNLVDPLGLESASDRVRKTDLTIPSVSDCHCKCNVRIYSDDAFGLPGVKHFGIEVDVPDANGHCETHTIELAHAAGPSLGHYELQLVDGKWKQVWVGVPVVLKGGELPPTGPFDGVGGVHIGSLRPSIGDIGGSAGGTLNDAYRIWDQVGSIPQSTKTDGSPISPPPGTKACDFAKDLLQKAKGIAANAGSIPYNLGNRNSNSFIWELLRQAHGKVDFPDAIDGAPGWREPFAPPGPGMVSRGSRILW